jgi:CheY-like chemotaxis protein
LRTLFVVYHAGGIQLAVGVIVEALTRHIPVVIYGAVEARDSRNEALRNGAVKVLSEPGLPADLTDVLREYLPKSQGTSRKPDAVTTASE